MSKTLKVKVTSLESEQIYALNENEKVFVQKFDIRKYSVEDIRNFHESVKQKLPKSIRVLTFPSDVEVEIWEVE